MSILKKGIQFAKKTIKKTVKFVRKNWKIIAIAALSVFTMGIATVGFAGFAGAMTAASTAGASGFGAFMSAVGSTMWAGATAAAGTIGIGSGASGAAAVAGGVEHMGLGAALGWNNGFGLGVAGNKAAAAAAQQAAITGPGVTTAAIGPQPVAVTSNVGTGGSMGTMVSGTNAAPVAESALKKAAVDTAIDTGAKTAASGGLGDLSKAALITTGGQMIAGYAAAKAAEEDDPLGFWGVDLTGKGNDVAPPTFQQAPAPQIEWFNGGRAVQGPVAPQIVQQSYQQQPYPQQPYPQQNFQPQPTGLMAPVAPQVGG